MKKVIINTNDKQNARYIKININLRKSDYQKNIKEY